MKKYSSEIMWFSLGALSMFGILLMVGLFLDK